MLKTEASDRAHIAKHSGRPAYPSNNALSGSSVVVWSAATESDVRPAAPYLQEQI